MILRAILAVLTLLGAVPFRVCTCGAAHVHRYAPPPAREDRAAPGPPAFAADTSTPQHHHDCPAAKPRAAMSVAVTASMVDIPADSPIIAAWVELPAAETMVLSSNDEPRSPDPPPKQPLFITYQSLRN
ncbi:MAG TPA: hypothetical protein VLM40_01330 [Gemmata sp.]|nr:hypothetical protein [Gemmata sp.]